MNPTHFMNSIEMKSLVAGNGTVPDYLKDWVVDLRVAVEEGNPTPFSSEEVINWYEYTLQHYKQPEQKDGVVYLDGLDALWELTGGYNKYEEVGRDYPYRAQFEDTTPTRNWPLLGLEEMMKSVSEAWYNTMKDKSLDGQYD